MAKTRHKRHVPSSVSNRQRRKALRRSQVRITQKTIQVRRAVSQRGRTHVMEAPAIGQPQQPQGVLLASTAIRKFKYNIKDKILRIWFVGGGVYDYFNVPESVVITFAQAQSKGRFFRRNIYGHWTGKPNQHPGVMKLIPDYQYKRVR